MFILRPERLPFGEHKMLLLNDLHIGSAEVDYDLLAKEIEEARKCRARVLINGDIGDFILPSDHKKYRPDAMHPRLRGKADILNVTLDWAEELLSPVASQIDLLGTGNHDDWWLKHHSADFVGLLARRLDRRQAYGGYTGFLDYRFSDSKRHAHRYVVWYHHGSGGGATASGAMAGLIKRSQFIDADLLWEGHRHFRIATHMRRLSCPEVGTGPRYSEVRYVMSGAYMDCWTEDTGDSRRASYAEDRALPPQGKGGTWLTLRVEQRKIQVALEQR